MLAGDTDGAAAALPGVPAAARDDVARFLEKRGLKELAAEVVVDPEYRFELAARAGEALLEATAPWSLLKKAAAGLAAAAEAADYAAGDDDAAAAVAAAKGALRAGGASLVLALEAARLKLMLLAPEL